MVGEIPTTHKTKLTKEINMSKSTFGTVVYNAGEVQEQGPSYNYVTKTGVFEVKVDRIYGTTFVNETTKSTTDFVTFEFIVNGEDKIVAKELYAYTAKESDKEAGIKKGDMVHSKGYNLVAALVGMQSGKAKATAKWSKCVVKEFGKDVNAMELKALAGKSFKIKSQIVRSIYTNKDDESFAKEDNSIARVFSATGHSLSEYETAIELAKSQDIEISEALGQVEGKAIETEAKRTKPRYNKCTKDEWQDIKDMESDDDTDEEDTDDLPEDIDDDEEDTETGNESSDDNDDDNELPDNDDDDDDLDLDLDEIDLDDED